MEDENYLFTVGHSNVDMETFLELIRSHGVELIVDVRSSPYSKYVPHFNREKLKANLEDEGVGYEFLGDKIGGKPRDEKYYEDGKVVYSLIEGELSYREGISQLMELLKTRKTSLMCSEENPFNCHRHNLISQTLLRRGVKILHIRGDGKLEKARMNDVQTTLI
ncbi:DUF488 domain-containing protein [Methanobacterium congolense]|uniref:DUF488 domain-containing protein n=1 Tax=Methanobacterium congolense TaxID=118062 RepID=A0A1D3L1J7_9EURY|nr:DUF488 domain-containing protein [Methanobacterium congolense]SCG85438.1 putative protein [Methanobacterium congolense]